MCQASCLTVSGRQLFQLPFTGGLAEKLCRVFPNQGMVFRRGHRLGNLYPCFLSGIHFVIIWVHITRNSVFYFSGGVLEFEITVSHSQSSSLWYCSCSDKCLTYLCLTSLFYETWAIPSSPRKIPRGWINLFATHCSGSRTESVLGAWSVQTGAMLLALRYL